MRHRRTVITTAAIFSIEMPVNTEAEGGGYNQAQDQPFPKGAAMATTPQASPADMIGAGFAFALRLESLDGLIP